MKKSISAFLLFLIALFATTQLASISVAQDEVDLVIDDDQQEDEGDGIRILINGKEFEIDGKQIESFIEENGEELEDWAERHAKAWEKWAEKFEKKMESWAEETEEEWEEWAEKYSGRWEKWADKLEADEIKGEELGELLESNLEMLGDMPLGELIEGALKNSLGELEDAPFESIDELGEIIGGAIEQSLGALESELEGGLRGIRINLTTGKQLSLIHISEPTRPY